MRTLVITDTAKEDIESVCLYLSGKFSNKIKMKFLVQLSEIIFTIEKMPFIYPISTTSPLLRRCVIHKNSSLFYKVTDQYIIIVSIVDSRIDPDTLKSMS